MTTVNLLFPRRYNNPNDARMRLKHSIVRYKDRPIWVDDVKGTTVLFWYLLYDTAGSKLEECHHSDKDLNIDSPPLGWTSFRGRVIYLTRNLINAQKQGLSLYAISTYEPLKDILRGGETFKRVTDLEAVGLTILGKFPVFTEALCSVKGGPFDREWALIPVNKRYVSVWNKDVCVALFDRDKRIFQFSFLSKTRKNSLNKLTGGCYEMFELKGGH